MKTQNKINQYVNEIGISHAFGLDYHTKQAFHSCGKKLLKAIAKEANWNEFKVRSCLGGDAVWGEVTLHTPTIYLMIHHSFSDNPRLLYRSCKGMDDYSGGQNNYMDLNKINIDTLKKLAST